MEDANDWELRQRAWELLTLLLLHSHTAWLLPTLKQTSLIPPPPTCPWAAAISHPPGSAAAVQIAEGPFDLDCLAAVWDRFSQRPHWQHAVWCQRIAGLLSSMAELVPDLAQAMPSWAAALAGFRDSETGAGSE